MNFIIKKTEWKGKPLCTLEDNSLVCYYKGRIIRYHLDNLIERQIVANIPAPFFKRIILRIRIIERIMHFDVRWGILVSKVDMLILLGTNIFRLNIGSGNFNLEFKLNNTKPLSVYRIKNIKGFEDGILIGDYSSNKKRKNVCIYMRTVDKEGSPVWKTVYTFQPGKIRHIHGFATNYDKSGIYIMTGDEDKESGIWMAKKGFEEVKEILVGQQQYRCCQLLANAEGIIYLTDAPSEDNHLYFYDSKGLKKISEIYGTCIYGTHWKKFLFASTVVEPDYHAKNRWEYWLTNVPGNGIKGKQVKILCISEEGKIYNLMEFMHDGKPLRLAQYATAYFSSENNEKIYFSPVSVMDDDNNIFEITVEQ